MIEVGWEPTRDLYSSSEPEVLELSGNTEPAMELLERPRAFPEGDEPVDDHYAALRAWSEWAKNQGRVPLSENSRPGS